MKSKQPKIGLALGGGGARGLAHIGILKVLEREKIPVDMICGSSFGAIVGAVYACHGTTTHLEKEVERVLGSDSFHKAKRNFLRHDFEEEKRVGLINNFKNFLKRQLFFSVAFRQRGLVSQEEFAEIIHSLVPDMSIEETAIPFACVATDLSHGTEIVLDEGPLRPALYGSSAIPGVFPPIHFRGRELVDGGWVNRVPVAPLRLMGADVVIGVDISEDLGRETGEQLKTGLAILIRANNITGRMLCNLQLASANVVVRPQVGHLHWAAFDHAKLCVRRGEKAMEAALPALVEILNQQGVTR